MNKPKTFAERAKVLIRKYSKANFDKRESDELEAELAKLSEEQEAFKQANGLGEYEQESSNMFPNGGLMDTYNPNGTPIQTNQNLMGVWNYNPSEVPIQNNQAYTPVVTQSQNISPASNFNNDVLQGELSPYKTSITPSIISGAASALGNLYLARQAGKQYSPTNLPRVNPETIDLSRSREAIKEQGSLARSSAQRSISQGAGSRGQYLAGISAASTGINRNLSDAIGSTYEKEALTNAQARQMASSQNAQLAAQEAGMNQLDKQLSNAEKNAYLAAAIGTIPQTMRDINMTKSQDKMAGLGQGNFKWETYKDPITGKKSTVKVFTDPETGESFIKDSKINPTNKKLKK